MARKAEKQKARAMRHQPTDAEKRLWGVLRHKRLENYKFRRQHRIGPYIADFACVTSRLIVEADGGQHADNKRDAQRTEALEKWGWRMIRFWNPDILSNTQGVLETILEVLKERKDVPTYEPPVLELIRK